MQLSKYFTLVEMTVSQTAARRGIPNIPDAEAIASLTSLCQHVMDLVRDHYGIITPSSGYRSHQLNIAVGGAEDSQHCVGEACDFTVPGVPVLEVCRWIRANIPVYDQLIQEFTSVGGGWVHVSYRRKGGNRKAFLKIG